MNKVQLIKKAISLMPTAEDMFQDFPSDWEIELTTTKFTHSYVTAQQNADITFSEYGKKEALAQGDVLFIKMHYGFKAFENGKLVSCGETSTKKELFYVNKLIAA